MRPIFLSFPFLATPVLADVPNVVTDIAPVHSIVSAVMQGVGEPSLIIPPGASPHGYAMRPSEARALAKADVVVWVGHGLTPWLEEPIGSLAPQAVRVELTDVEGMRLLGFREGVAFEDAHDHGHGHGDDHEDDHGDEDGHEDHAEEGHDAEKHAEHGHDDHDDHGDHAEDKHADHDHKEEAHGHKDEDHAEADDHEDHAGEGADPHVWLDPVNGAAAAVAIAQVLSERDPANASKYSENAKSFRRGIEAQSKGIQTQLTPVANRPFIVFHDAFHYFEARFDIEARGSVSTGDAAKPGAARIAKIRGTVADTQAVCAFAEPQMNTDILQTVTEGQDTRIATLDPLGASLELGPTLYPMLLKNLASAMADCLK